MGREVLGPIRREGVGQARSLQELQWILDITFKIGGLRYALYIIRNELVAIEQLCFFSNALFLQFSQELNDPRDRATSYLCYPVLGELALRMSHQGSHDPQVFDVSLGHNL